MIVTVFIVLVLAACVVAVHYLVMHQLASRFVRFADERVRWVVAGLMMLIAAHALEIVIFSSGYLILDFWMDDSGLLGSNATELWDYVYFSAMTYTTVGYGDYYPIGELRAVAAIEAIVGLLMIAWSGAFSVYFLQRSWARYADFRDGKENSDKHYLQGKEVP
jgi:hypothetical protein